MRSINEKYKNSYFILLFIYRLAIIVEIIFKILSNWGEYKIFILWFSATLETIGYYDSPYYVVKFKNYDYG